MNATDPSGLQQAPHADGGGTVGDLPTIIPGDRMTVYGPRNDPGAATLAFALGARLSAAANRSQASPPKKQECGDEASEGCTDKVTVTAKRPKKRKDAPLHVQFFIGLTEIPGFLGEMRDLTEKMLANPEKTKHCSNRCSLLADAEKKFNPLNKVPKYTAQIGFYALMRYLGEGLVGQYVVWGYNGVEAGKFLGDKADCMSKCMNGSGS
jgi:hypothetical protein